MTNTAVRTMTPAPHLGVADALAACRSVTEPSQEHEDLMMAIWSTVCTRRSRTVTPMGSVAPVAISSDYASTELIAVMDWLRLHEYEARALSPDRLYRTMRAVATMGMNGSGRAARADQLRGLVDVPAGTPVRWAEVDQDMVVS